MFLGVIWLFISFIFVECVLYVRYFQGLRYKCVDLYRIQRIVRFSFLDGQVGIAYRFRFFFGGFVRFRFFFRLLFVFSVGITRVVIEIIVLVWRWAFRFFILQMRESGFRELGRVFKGIVIKNRFSFVFLEVENTCSAIFIFFRQGFYSVVGLGLKVRIVWISSWRGESRFLREMFEGCGQCLEFKVGRRFEVDV